MNTMNTPLEKQLESKIGYGNKIIYKILKRGIDIIISIAALIIFTPIIILFAVIIKLESRGSWVYRQERVGLNGKPFTIYKLRTMYKDAEIDGPKLTQKNDSRITKVGRIIRKKRIDELPQFVNILKGNMSIVGPRPERPFFMDMYCNEIPDFKKRLMVKPGLTGWAQINGGYNLSPGEKLEMDLYYITNQSILMDIKIIAKTIKIVITSNGAR